LVDLLILNLPIISFAFNYLAFFRLYQLKQFLYFIAWLYLLPKIKFKKYLQSILYYKQEFPDFYRELITAQLRHF